MFRSTAGFLGVILFCGFCLAALGAADLIWLWRIENSSSMAQAHIDSATRTTGRRGGYTYSLSLSFANEAGQRIVARQVSVTRAFVGQIIENDRVVRPTVSIRYLASDIAHPLVVEDADNWRSEGREMLGAGGLVFAGGAIGILYLRRRARRQAAASNAPQG